MNDQRRPVGELVSAEDVCMCGDYRRHHKDGTGLCVMPNDLVHGYARCNVFVLFRKAVA